MGNDAKIQFEKITTQTGWLTVVRDDLLPGGTKQRGAIPFLDQFRKNGVKEFVYASPFAGFAQVALAKSCAILDVKCTIFAEQIESGMSDYTKSISDKAEIRLMPTLAHAERAAEMYCQQSNRFKIPLGFDHPLFRKCLRRELNKQWKYLCNSLGFIPKNLWLPVGSGTLATTFSKITSSTNLKLIDVRVLRESDERIQGIRRLKKSEYFQSPYSFHSIPAKLPPIPSNPFYDAKLWQFITEGARPYDVWWNVAA